MGGSVSQSTVDASLAAAVSHPQPLGSRPSRQSRMPSLWAIVQYWHSQEDFGVPDIARPHCFACERPIPFDESHSLAARWNRSTPYLDRAHLVDRIHNGLDGPQNLMPMCRWPCHKLMPQFYGTEPAGARPIDWVFNGGWGRPPVRAAGRTNLLPMCRSPCHKLMPQFYRTEPAGSRPIDWVLNGGWRQYLAFREDGTPYLDLPPACRGAGQIVTIDGPTGP